MMYVLLEATINADNAKEILKRFPKGMQKIGITSKNIDSLSVLGVGTHGTAFELPDGKVLKITNDFKEASAAAALLGKNVKNIVNFYDAWQFGDTGIFGILQEKVEQLSSSEGEAFNKALIATAAPLWIKRAGGSWDTVKKLTKQHIVDSVKKKFKNNLNSPEAQQFVKNINEQWNLLVSKYGIKDMFETLNALGIEFHDYHAGNMMQRNDGTIVLIDLGISNVKGNGKLKTMTESIIDRWPHLTNG